MDPISAASGASRVALQVLTSRKRPVLELYANLRHRIGPEEIYKSGGRTKADEIEHRFRPQDIFIEFLLTNVGAVRAENIKLSFQGDFSKNSTAQSLGSMRIFSGRTIPQLAPAQTFPLFLLDSLDLMTYEYEGNVGRPSSIKTEGFTITADYDGPKGGLNRVGRLISRIRKRKQYRLTFMFDPQLYEGLDLPAAEYA